MITNLIYVEPDMVKSTSMRTRNCISISFIIFTFISITVPGTISGAPTTYNYKGGGRAASGAPRTEQHNGPSYQVWDQDKPSVTGIHIPTLYEIENAVKNTAKKIYDKYLGNLTNDDNDAECLLGSAQIYLWWIDDAGHIRPQLGYKEEALCDISNSNLTESSIAINEEELTEAKPKILIMSLANNNFTEVPFFFLQHTGASLEKLSLMGNHLKKNPLHFPKMTKLEELDLRSCELEALNAADFSTLTSLMKLVLSHNKLKTINAAAFQGLTKLRHLDLSYNRYPFRNASSVYGRFDEYWSMLQGLELSDNVFQKLKNLHFLDLSHTKLQVHSGVAFGYLGPKVEQLSLCYTEIPVIVDNMFDETNMKVLDLSGNPSLSSTFNNRSLGGIEDNLEIFAFQNSYIKHIDWVSNLTNIEILLLTGNNINQAPFGAFDDLENLKILDLSGNHLTHWYIRLFEHNDLRVLDLRSNNINVISKEMIKDFQNVDFLAIGRNNFLCNCLLREFLEVAAKNTADMTCTDKTPPIVDETPEVQRSSVTKSIKGLFTWKPPAEYDVYTRVLNQYLSEYNKTRTSITRPPKSEVDERFNRERYNIKPSSGDEHNGTDSDDMEDSDTSQDDVESEDDDPEVDIEFLPPLNPNEIYCNNSKSHTLRFTEEMEKKQRNETTIGINLQLLDYTDADYMCINSNSTIAYFIAELEECSHGTMVNVPHIPMSKETYIGFIITYTLLGFCTISLIGVIYYYRGYDIKYFCIVFRNVTVLSLMDKEKRKLLKRNKDAESNEYTYDVFVSYSDQNRDWVLEHLLPNIEREDELNVCLHERDFKVGLTILENIISCMDQSRCILLIISKSFVSSNWCQFELHLAQHRLLETRREQLIIVLLEDIPRLSRPRTLEYLMRTKTYLEWPEYKAPKPGKKLKRQPKQDPEQLDEKRKNFWKRLKESIKTM